MMYKKESKLSNDFLNNIRISETEIIMSRLSETKKIEINIPTRRKWILALNAVVILVVVSLFFIMGNSPTNPDYTFTEVYDDLIELQTYFHELAPNSDTETSNNNLVKLSSINPDYVKQYDYLYNLYHDNEIVYDNSDHDEYFLNASMHFDLFIDILGMYEYVPLFKWVDSVDNDSIDRFKIMVHDNGYFTIATMKEHEEYEEYNVFYLGLNDDLFEMDHIRYDGDINITGSDTSFIYYQYLQEQQTKYINSNDYGISVDYVSFEDNTRIYFAKDHETFLTEEIDETVYSISYYDVESMIDYSLSFTMDEILSETYTLRNQYGSVFGYSDYNTQDDTVRVYFNLMETTGWDYASFHPTNEEERGVYKDDQKIFTDYNVYLSKQYKYINVGVSIETDINEITNELLDLSLYDLEFYNGQIDMNYIETMRISDLDTFISNIEVDGNNFNELTDRELLYQSLRSILRNSILVVD